MNFFDVIRSVFDEGLVFFLYKRKKSKNKMHIFPYKKTGLKVT